MKITSLGHGGAFAGIDKGNTSYLVEVGGKKILFDCGTLVPYILRDEFGINFHDIDAVYISHGHSDHCGGLALFLQSRFWIPKLDSEGNRVVPKLFIAGAVFDEICSYLDDEVRHFKNDEYFELDGDFADIIEMHGEGSTFTFGDVTFELIKQWHVPYGKYSEKPVFGLEFEYKGKKFLFTADAADVADLNKYDFVFHDCETGNFKSGVHAHFDDIIAAFFAIPLDKRPNLYLTHYTNAREGEELNNLRWFEKGSKLIIN